jgi:hypothetical protein
MQRNYSEQPTRSQQVVGTRPEGLIKAAIDDQETRIAALESGGGSGGNSVTAQIDFGQSDGFASVDVAATWAVTGMDFIVLPLIPTTADHDPEDVLLEGVRAMVTAVDDGVGFTLSAASNGTTWGRYDFLIKGA